MFRKVDKMNKEKITEILQKSNQKFKQIMELKFLFYVIIAISVIVFGIAAWLKQYNIALTAITIIWGYNILYSLANVKKRFLFLIMNLMLFTFVLDRPLISMFRGDVWWYFSNKAVMKALSSIMITETFLLAGNRISEKIPEKEKNNAPNHLIKTLKILLLISVIITGVVSAYVEIVKYIDMKDVDYALNYTDEVIEFPLIIRTIATLFSYCTFAYLSTMPNKKFSIITLGIYVLLAIPSFLLGSRNALILRIVFSAVYIMCRHIIDKGDGNWITTKMKIIATVMIPIAIMFLGAYNYIRSDEEVETSNPILLVVDFFYKQGTTFDTICQGFEYEENFKNQPNVVSYTFGDIIDYLIHNTISQKLFGTEDLGSGNSITMVEKSNSLAHRLSYVVLGETPYLSGHGRGTSYIIETYMDIGMVGVAIYSLILGIYLSKIVTILQKGKFIINYIVLTSMSQIFLLPRYSASGFMSFIVTPQFWIITGSILVAKVLTNIKNKGETHV